MLYDVILSKILVYKNVNVGELIERTGRFKDSFLEKHNRT
jgi:hypothetical protein